MKMIHSFLFFLTYSFFKNHDPLIDLSFGFTLTVHYNIYKLKTVLVFITFDIAVLNCLPPGYFRVMLQEKFIHSYWQSIFFRMIREYTRIGVS